LTFQSFIGGHWRGSIFVENLNLAGLLHF
jgi:hypothetical protein